MNYLVQCYVSLIILSSFLLGVETLEVGGIVESNFIDFGLAFRRRKRSKGCFLLIYVKFVLAESQRMA